MEVADNQHPIDLSRKCRYYEQPRSFIKSSSVSSSRPLPDLIPISLFHEVSSGAPKRDRELIECFKTCKQSLLTLQFKERSRERKEASRFRGVPHATPTPKMRKSKSDTRLSFPQHSAHSYSHSHSHSYSNAESSATLSRTTGANYLSIPMQRNAAITRSDGIRKYVERDKNHNYNSSWLANSRHDKRSDEDEITSSVNAHSSRHVRQGPGVSLSTIQSLRKLLDKRKSMQKGGSS